VKPDHFFVDEVKINNQTVLTIPIENQYYEEEKPKRKSRWGEKIERKSKKIIKKIKKRENFKIIVNQESVFIPLERKNMLYI
jgi:hypothetical protein